MDSLILQHLPVFGADQCTLFFIDQDSFRYDPFKKLVIYYYPEGKAQRRYLGTYQILTKQSFELGKISDMMCIMFFSQRQKEGIQRLLNFKFRGPTTINSKCCMASAFRVSYETKYEVPENLPTQKLPVKATPTIEIVPPF